MLKLGWNLVFQLNLKLVWDGTLCEVETSRVGNDNLGVNVSHEQSS